MKEQVMKEVKDIFRPEFINRVDELIVFHALEQSDIDKIAYLMLSQVADRLKKRGMHLSFDDEVVSLLSKEGYDPQYGARPLRRVIQRTVEDALSEEIIAGSLALGDDVRLFVKDGKIAFEKAEQHKPTVEEEVKA